MTDPLRDRVAAALGASYDIEAEIGRGGMGVVYRCRDRKLRRPVAIKVLPPDLAFRDEVRTRFLREAETAAQLNHPNIVPIYGVDDRDGLVWFVMALVDGESLAARLARERRPPFAEVRRILRDVADALAYAHARGIIHRDIKPDNILLDRLTGRPLVTDFGIARAVEGDSRLTVTGIAVGTPAYMSPEQAMGEREIDGRSDIYSLAVVGYQMLAGELPFQASNTPAMLMKHISDPLKPLGLVRPDTPPALAAAVERALAKKPASRFVDAAAFRDALDAASVDPVEAGPASMDPARPGSRAGEARHVSGSWKRPAVPAPAILAPARPSTRSGWTSRRTPPSDGDLPPVPPWMPESWREARQEWRQKEQGRRGRPDKGDESEAPTREERIRRFRISVARTGITVGMLAGINMAFSPGFPWFLFPAGFMTIGLLHHGASLWADGIRWRDIFGREAAEGLKRRGGAATPPARAPTLADLAERLAPRDVLAGPYGDIVRRAAADRAAGAEALARLAAADRALIPDVAPSLDALAERVGSIAAALHRLEEDLTESKVADLDARIAALRAAGATPEVDRKLALLERQRTTLADLEQRRDTLRAQMESAALMLQNMRLDLLALRSAGVQSALDDVTSATQEARALSRDIQIALEAAREIRS